MNIFTLMVTISSVMSGLFVLALNWSLGIDYSDPYTSMVPLAIAWLAGIATVSLWGGSVGAWFDLKDEN